VIVALDTSEIIYFELNSLNNLDEVNSKMLDARVISLDIGEIEQDRSWFKFLAIGTSDKTVKLLSLDTESCLDWISV